MSTLNQTLFALNHTQNLAGSSTRFHTITLKNIDSIIDHVFRDFPELKPPKGKFRIMGIDKFEIPGEGHWVVGDFDNSDEAIKKAKEMTRNASKDATDPSVATVFYAYDENGSYLGGDMHDED